MLIKENIKFSRFSVFLIILVVLACALVIYLSPVVKIYQKGQTGSVRSLNDNSTTTTLKTNSFTNISQQNFGVSAGISNRYIGSKSLENINDDNLVVTYNSVNNINLNNVPLDILEGKAILEKINIDNCIDVDQIAVEYVSKTCQNLLCRDNFGNRIVNGQTITTLETRKDVPRCTGIDLGYLTFNFGLDPRNNTPLSDVVFMQFENFFLGTTVYNDYLNDSSLEYYFSNNIFVKDDYINKNEIVPRILHRPFSKNSIRQKVAIQRYSKTPQGDINEDATGNLAELIFRPTQIYLTSEGVSGQITSIQKPPSGYLESFDINSKYAVRAVSQNNNTSAKCIVDSDNNIRIIDGGKDYLAIAIAGGVSIQNDNNEFVGAFNFNFTQQGKRLLMKNRNGNDGAVWLLVPPQDLNPEGITKENKITKGYIQDFSIQSNINNLKEAVPEGLPPYSRVTPGTVISPILFENSTFNPLNIDGILISPFGNSNVKIVFAGGQTIGAVYNLFTTGSIRNNSNFTVAPGIYSQYPDNLYKAVNTYPAFANPKNLNNQGTVMVTALEANRQVGGKNYAAFIGVSPNNNPIVSLRDDIILDGAAEWLEINPFTDVLAFNSEYFTQNNLSIGQSTVTSTSDLTINNLNFVEPIFGKVETINVTGANYNDVDLPNLSASQLINLDNTTLTVSENSGGVIGKDAQCLLSFTTQGTSTFVSLAQVTKAGSSFSAGTFDILASAIQTGLTGSIKNISIETISDDYVFRAVTVNSDDPSQPVNPSQVVDDNDFNITYGLIVDPIKNQTISLDNPIILEGGQKYKVNQTYYINQFIGNSSDSVFGASFSSLNISKDNMEKLPSLTITGVSNNRTFEPSYFPLIPTTSPLEVEYNFWEDSPATYLPSPQQVVFYGDFRGTSIPYIGDPALNFKEFLIANKIDESAYTEISFLNSLQIPSFYYTTDGYTNVKNYEGLTLKRFIPYREFTPPEKNPGDTIPTGKGTTTYTNYNYLQFIPYGVEDIYKKPFTNGYDSLPTF